EPGLGGDVFKLEAAEVAVEFARMTLDLFLVGAVEVAAADDEQVEQAVAVEIEGGQPAAQRFEQRVVSGLLTITIGEVDAGIRGDVAEEGRDGRRRAGIGTGFLRGRSLPAAP